MSTIDSTCGPVNVPALNCGPTNNQVEPENKYNCELVVSTQRSPAVLAATDGAVPAFLTEPAAFQLPAPS